MIRKLLILVAVLLAAAVGFGLSTLNTGVRRATDAYVASVVKAGKRKVSYSSTGISLLPFPVVVVRDFVVESKEEFGEEPLLRAPEVRVKPKLLPMLTGRAEIGYLELIAPVLRVARRSAGETDLGAWLAGVPEGESGRVTVPLAVTSGRVEFEQLGADDDSTDGPLRIVFEDISAQLEPTRGDGRTAFVVDGAAPGESARFQVSGSVRPTGEATKGLEVDVEYEIADFDTGAAQPMLPSVEGIFLSGPLSLAGGFNGFAGGRSTESRPAEKLLGTVKGNGYISAFGVVEPVSVDMKVSDKDGRLRLDDARFTWSGVDFTAKGWTSHTLAQNALLNIDFVGFDTDAVLAKYGYSDAMRPRSSFDGHIRMEGTLKRPLFRYEAESKGMEMDFYSSYPVKVGPMKAKGILLSISADFSASINADFLSVGPMRVDDTSFGFRYWRDKLTFNLTKVEVWDAIATVAARYEPREANANEVAGLFDDLDAGVALSNVFPNLKPKIDGRMDAIVQLGSDDHGTWAMGRIGVHEGNFPGLSFGTAVVESIASQPGLRPLRDAEIQAAFTGSMSGNATKFRTVKFDFQSREGGFDLGSVLVRTDALEFRGAGLVSGAGVIDLDGDAMPIGAYRERVFAQIPALRRIQGDDRMLHIPVSMDGALDSLRIGVAPEFVTAATLAAAGKLVSPPAVPSARKPLEFDLPVLADEYGR